MKKSVETFQAFLDSMLTARDPTSAARANLFHPVTARRWIVESKGASKAGVAPEESIFYFEWPAGSGTFAWFWEHERACLRAKMDLIESGIQDRAVRGTRTRALVAGRPQFEPNILFEETSETKQFETDLDLLINGFPTRWKRDAAFRREYVYVWTPPASENAVTAISAYRARYNRRLTVDHSHSGNIAVTHAALPAPATREQLEARLLPEIEGELVDGTDVLEPSSAEIEEAVVEEIVIEPEPEPEPVVAPAPPAPKPNSPMQEELLRLARLPPEERAALAAARADAARKAANSK